MRTQSGSLPARHQKQRQLIVDFWTRYDASQDPGAASWVTLDELRLSVTDLLYDGGDAALKKAEALTAKAMVLMQGVGDS